MTDDPDERPRDEAANDSGDEADAESAGSDAEAESWWSIEGETTGERVRNGAPQLAIVVVVVWLGTSMAYNVLSAAFDPTTATASIVLGSLWVGLRLRRWLIVDSASSGDRTSDEDPDEGAHGETGGERAGGNGESDAVAEENRSVTEEKGTANDDAAPDGDAAGR